MTINTSSGGPIKITAKKTGLAAALEADALEKEKEIAEKRELSKSKPPITYVPAKEATTRIKIIFDDSGSMYGRKIKDARDGCIEFMRNCQINETAVGVFPMNYTDTDLNSITTNLPALSILIGEIKDSGNTPMFETLLRAMNSSPKATRYIIFSDGQPDNQNNKEGLIERAIKEETPIDTVLIVDGGGERVKDLPQYILMKEIADRTKGFFLLFDNTKVNFAKAFKYLAPVNRLRLADKSFRDAVEAGTI